MRQTAVDLGRYLARHLGVVGPWDATPQAPEVYPVARIRTTRALRGTVHRAVALTPYETQMLVEDLVRMGPGTAVEITLPTDVPAAVCERAERDFGRLRTAGVEVAVHRADGYPEPPLGPPAPPSLSRTVAELAVLMGRLLHELQSERALTAAHLTAREGTATAHLEAQWHATDGVLAVWGALLIVNADMVPPLVRMHADAVSSLLTQLDPTRRRVEVRVSDVAVTTDYYTQLTHALLATVDGLVVAAGAAPTMTAHLAFLHAKEEAAVEQLEVASASVRQSLSHSLAARVASRAAYLRTFATTAPEQVLSEYRLLMGETCRDTPDLEQALIEHECPDDAADAEAWYRSLVCTFERFHDVESCSAASLLESTA